LDFGLWVWTLNYFNYFTEIEDAFIRRRAKHLLLSPMDWALIESWKEIGVPLHVALRGIEKAFDSWESKPRKRSIKSLLYCQEEVEAQFAEWREARVGAGDEAATEANGTHQASDALPFSRAAILAHLQRGRATLSAVRDARLKTVEDDFSETVKRAVALLAELEEDLDASAAPDARKLEQSLTGSERMLSEALRSVVSAKQLDILNAEVKEQLKPYRKQMEPEVYQQTFDNLLMKRLRELFGIPRLSLFYL
jgi:hypothetical protein